jgi:hypothetical protein
MAARYDKAVKMDPLEQAMQVYQMFNNPQNNDLDAILGFVNQQEGRDIQRQTLEQSRALKERELAQEGQKIDILGREANIKQQVAGHKAEITPEQTQALTAIYTDPKSTGPQKLMAKYLLPPGLIQQIDAQASQFAGDIAGPGARPAGAPTQTPIGPVTAGSILGNAARQGFGMEPNTQPFNIMDLLKRLFQTDRPPNAFQPNPDVYSAGPNFNP